MQIKEFLEKVCGEIKYKPIQNDVTEELKCHMEEIKEEQIENGIEENKAEEIAVKRMGEPIEIGKKLNKIHKPKLDWGLILIVIILVGFGIVVSFIKTQSDLTDGTEIAYFIKNIIFTIIGIVLGIGIYFFDYTKTSKYSKYIYLVATIISLSWLIGISQIGHNGKAYLQILNISIESIAIPLYIVAFVGYINNYNKNNIFKFGNITINKDFIKILILSVFSICVLKSLSSCLILLSVYIILVTVGIVNKSSKKKKYLLILYGIIAISMILFTFIVQPLKIGRIIAFVKPEENINGEGWIIIQQRLILNSSKLIGQAEDLSESLEIFDEGTDYAVVSLIAHYGIIAAIILVMLILIFSAKLIYNSKIIKDNYGKLLIIGIGGYFMIECILNVLMNLTIGMQISSKIPFVSYSGKSLIIDIMCVAFILSIYRKKDIIRA